MLDLFNFTPIVIIILSIFQTIIGVGILVLGTPILLLIGLEMIEVMKILLPLSILNSSLNILFSTSSVTENEHTDRHIGQCFCLRNDWSKHAAQKLCPHGVVTGIHKVSKHTGHCKIFDILF